MMQPGMVGPDMMGNLPGPQRSVLAGLMGAEQEWAQACAARFLGRAGECSPART